jgi:hypothetical protein
MSQPGTPAEPIPDSGDMRILNLEHSMYEMQNRMLRWEETNYILSSRCQALAECLVKCHQVSGRAMLCKDVANVISLVDKFNLAGPC